MFSKFRFQNFKSNAFQWTRKSPFSSSASSNAKEQSSFFQRFSKPGRKFVDWYSGQMDKRPFTTQMTTSGILFFFGDVSSQIYEQKLDKEAGETPTPFNWGRLAACTCFGIFGMGPLGHLWYLHLDKFVGRALNTRSVPGVLSKIFIDITVFNPLFLAVFFTSVSVMEGHSMDWISHKMKLDLVPSALAEAMFWPNVQFVNFKYVPLQFQLLLVNIFCYFDSIFLSYVQHNGMPWFLKYFEDKWLDYIGESKSKDEAHEHEVRSRHHYPDQEVQHYHHTHHHPEHDHHSINHHHHHDHQDRHPSAVTTNSVTSSSSSSSSPSASSPSSPSSPPSSPSSLSS